MSNALRAVVLDFDGLILDTEMPEFVAWREVYANYGYELDQGVWTRIIGTQDADWDPYTDLASRLGRPLDRTGLDRIREARLADLIAAETLRPGVDAWLTEARELRLKVGIATSSSARWVEGHLARLGMRNRFDALATKDDVARTKPDPAVYREVLRRLRVGADEAIAVEDSPNGIAAAKAAGLFCVAVPNALTEGLDLSRADVRYASLADVTISRLR